MDNIALWVVGGIALVGGFELARWGWSDRQQENRDGSYYRSNSWDWSARSGHMTVGAGIFLMVFSGYCFWGAYHGWNVEHVLKSFMSSDRDGRRHSLFHFEF